MSFRSACSTRASSKTGSKATEKPYFENKSSKRGLYWASSCIYKNAYKYTHDCVPMCVTSHRNTQTHTSIYSNYCRLGDQLQEAHVFEGIHGVSDVNLFYLTGVREKGTHKLSWCFSSLFLLFFIVSLNFFSPISCCFTELISQQNLQAVKESKQLHSTF